MLTLRQSVVSVLILLSLHVPTVTAQSATVTNNVWFRTFMVKGKEIGTIFSIDVDEREYWITAKHILTGAKHPPFGTVEASTVTLGILPQSESDKDWKPISFKVMDPGKDVDIVVLAPESSLLPKNGIQSAKVSSVGTMFGGECEFVGFPFSTQLSRYGRSRRAWCYTASLGRQFRRIHWTGGTRYPTVPVRRLLKPL
jgi:hypothetical protein